ncbi:MAG: thiamine phosphate synthase [Aestuariivita sp.]|nr:thiamine phosphate synthase [Aestuariivita sp.]
MKKNLRQLLRLYLIIDLNLCGNAGLLETVRQAISGGVTMVQLRHKDGTTDDRVKMAMSLKPILANSGIPLIINDDIEAAVAVNAAGAHVGQNDMLPHEAKRLLGPDRILGLSCETEDHIQLLNLDSVDYIGIGPVFSTDSKSDHAQPIGFDGLAKLINLSPVPTVAIGGLKAIHMNRVFAAGADGVAVISAICGQPDPAASARAFFKVNER